MKNKEVLVKLLGNKFDIRESKNRVLTKNKIIEINFTYNKSNCGSFNEFWKSNKTRFISKIVKPSSIFVAYILKLIDIGLCVKHVFKFSSDDKFNIVLNIDIEIPKREYLHPSIKAQDLPKFSKPLSGLKSPNERGQEFENKCFDIIDNMNNTDKFYVFKNIELLRKNTSCIIKEVDFVIINGTHNRVLFGECKDIDKSATNDSHIQKSFSKYHKLINQLSDNIDIIFVFNSNGKLISLGKQNTKSIFDTKLHSYIKNWLTV